MSWKEDLAGAPTFGRGLACKIPGEDETNVSEMTVGQLKTHVDRAFKQVDKRFDNLSLLFESLRDDIHKVADGVAAQTNTLNDFRNEIATDRIRYDGRLDDHEVRITALERRKRRRRA